MRWIGRLVVVSTMMLSVLAGVPASSSFAAAQVVTAAPQTDELALYASVLAGQEGFCSWAYLDTSNYWTIGYGFELRQNRQILLKAGIQTVEYPSLTTTPGYRVGDQDVNTTRASLTQPQALVVLTQILPSYVTTARTVFGYSVKEWNAENPNRRAAMVSMIYNGWKRSSPYATRIQKAIKSKPRNWSLAGDLSALRYEELGLPERAETIPVLLDGDLPAFTSVGCAHAFVASVTAKPAKVAGTDGKPVTVDVTAASDPLVIPNTKVTTTAAVDDPAIAKAEVKQGDEVLDVESHGGTDSGSVDVTCLKKGSTTAVVTLTGKLVAGSGVTPTPKRQVKVPVTCDGVSITTTSLPDAQAGVAYQAQLTASGGTEPYVWSVRGLPGGLSVDGHGLISGTPATQGTVSGIQAGVTDAGGDSATATFSLTVDAPLPPVPPGTPAAPPTQPACLSSCAASLGDPHLTTFDHAHYDFQQVGEFVAALSTVDDLQIQVRQQPWGGSRLVAGNTAVAFEVAGHRVGIYLTSSGVRTLVDGRPVTLGTSPYALPGGGTVFASDTDGPQTVAWPDGSFATVIILGGFLTMNVSVAPARQGHLVGLLGDDDGNAANDLTTRTGVALPYPATPAQLYGAYSASWRVTQTGSLFDYDAGQSTGTFTDAAFPYAYVDVDTLPADNRSAAAATCRAAGVTTEPYLDACILDLALTGDLGTVTAAAAAQTFQSPAPGNLVANGGFETPSDGGGAYIEYPGGSTAIPGWTVGGSSVDVVSTSYWAADEGSQSVDLAGSGPGSVSQTVATTPGATYTLSWSLAGNTNCGASVKTLNVEWNGTVVNAPAFDTTGHSNSSMGYAHHQVTVTAAGPSAQITFADATAGDSLCGPVLDNVALVRQG